MHVDGLTSETRVCVSVQHFFVRHDMEDRTPLLDVIREVE